MENRLSPAELGDMRKAGKVAGQTLSRLKKFIRPGITTRAIEKFFVDWLKKNPGMEAAFKGYSGYPASLCVAVNEEIIHGIPSDDRVIKAGDLVSVDLGVLYNGVYVDTAYTYQVAKVSPQARLLCLTGQECLKRAINAARPGARIGDIGEAVQSLAESRGFSVVRNFVGHGIGRDLHMEPEVPNYGKAGTGMVLEEGMIIAIEPMLCAGGSEVEIMADGWTARTRDKELSCHYEHTVAITARGPLVIT